MSCLRYCVRKVAVTERAYVGLDLELLLCVCCCTSIPVSVCVSLATTTYKPSFPPPTFILCRVHDLTLHDFLGEMKCTLAEVVSSSGGHAFSRALEGVPGKSR